MVKLPLQQKLRKTWPNRSPIYMVLKLENNITKICKGFVNTDKDLDMIRVK
jgi:hypothetical protein